VSTEQIRRLSGTVDGVNKNFTTPTPYVATSLRLIRNGQVYEADDSTFGWTEVSTTEIQLLEAPIAGEVLQGFYSELRSLGSPFDPLGVLP
jgi:hypothetical protein